jgi:prepilin-type N-terminal cleavage/methylation domain-containing protein
MNCFYHIPTGSEKDRLSDWSGFTLVELSIVLILIGLLLGGILVGQDLIRSAELRKDMRQIEEMNAFVLAFRNKYECLPGDCKHASSFFDGVGNGNGDGMIPGGMSYTGENETFELLPQHLALAGFASLSYWTAPDPNPWGYIPMSTKSDHAVYIGCRVGSGSGNDCHYVRAGFKALWNFGAGWEGINSNTPLYTPAEAYFIDNKLDDGMPLAGRINSGFLGSWDDSASYEQSIGSGAAGSGSCVSDAARNPYLLSEKIKACALVFKSDF